MNMKSKKTRRLYVWWSDDFKGYNPVGTAAVVVAATEKKARELLNAKQPWAGQPFSLNRLKLSAPSCVIVNDGNY